MSPPEVISCAPKLISCSAMRLFRHQRMWYLRIFPILRSCDLCLTHRDTPVMEQLTVGKSVQESGPVGGRAETVPQMESFLNIASLVYSSQTCSTRLFILTCCLSTSAWGPWGKQQTSTSLHVETRLGLQNTHICWNSPSPSVPMESAHHLNWGNRIPALDPIPGFKTNRPNLQHFLSISIVLDRDYRI